MDGGAAVVIIEMCGVTWIVGRIVGCGGHFCSEWTAGGAGVRCKLVAMRVRVRVLSTRYRREFCRLYFYMYILISSDSDN